MTSLKRILLVIFIVLFSNPSCATPLTGVLHAFDPFGTDLCEYPNSCGYPVTGDYDATAATLSFDPVYFMGSDLVADSVELLPAGTYVRPNGYGGNITATVAPGQVGAYVVLSWAGNTLPTFMVWNVSGTTAAQVFTPVDSDGDGIPGHAFTDGPFPGFTGIYEFYVGAPPPDIELTLDVTGGTSHECTSIDGTPIEITASINLTGGAELDSVSWVVDGIPAGTGNTLTPLLGLGTHNISATALTTTGETDSKSVTVHVVDTTAPALDVAFIDSRGGAAITSIDRPNVQWIEVRVKAADACDKNPQASAVGGFAVGDGDLLKIQGNNSSVIMTTSELVLSATATDASGNTSSGTATLHITE